MSFKDFIKNNVIDLGGDKPAQAPIKIVKAESKPVAQDVVYYDSAKPPSGRSSAPTNDQFHAHFDKLMDDSNQPGPDYYEFVKAKNVMYRTIADEATLYQTAFTVLQGSGLTKERIMSSSQVYIGIIDKELSDFDAQFQDQYKKQVDDSKTAIDQINQQMAALQQKKDTLMQNMQKGDEMKSKRDAFHAAGEEVKDNIKQEIEKINSFIN